MSNLHEELAKWFEELQQLPDDHHLLCPRIGPDDDENYKTFEDPESKISVDEKKKRIEDGNKRIEITYWNSLIFGFDKRDAGKWLESFTQRLEDTLKYCSECVLNWHMKRKYHLQKFSERWNDDVLLQIKDLLDRLDIARINHNLTWAKQFIEKIEDTGTVFKKSSFGEHLPTVHIAIYEALCCIPYMANPEQRTIFQYVFMRLQGKSYLKLGTKDPLPGMTYFLFDQKNEDRRRWAQENWKNIDSNSISEEQFDWAVSGGIISAIDAVGRLDLARPSSEMYLEIAQFWESFQEILRALTHELILTRLRSLETQLGSANIYDLLFRHIQHCNSEAVLVITIRVVSFLLTKSPKAFWDVVGDARPNVIADLLFGSPVYKALLRQSLEDCWTGFEPGTRRVPFPTSWIDPWLRSLSRDRRYDACEVLMHTLFETLAKDQSIGEPGQAACVRAGFDALQFTMQSFLDPEIKIGSGTTHLYANAAFNLVMKHKTLILQSLNPSPGNHEGWTTFQVADTAKELMQAAMKLDTKLFSEEFVILNNNAQLQSTVTRDSKVFWEGVVEMIDGTSDQVSLSKDILLSLSPLIVVEEIRRPKAASQLSESSIRFNAALQNVENVLARILGRVSELDATDLNALFSDRLPFQVTVGISVRGETDLAEAASEVLKSWTGELSRSGALEQMSQLHPDQTLASMVWTLERVLRPPFPWDPIRPILNMSRDVLRGLTDPSSGVLRVKTLDPKSAATVLRWWNEQWRFVSKACLNIEAWSFTIPNAIMTEFCREIMELAEKLIAEDGLLTSATALGRSEKDMMVRILEPAKENFRGMENMIRLKDRWLVDVTVRVLCKILKRLRENNLEINSKSRQLITDACVPTSTPGKYTRTTNLTDQQRAELLQALGHDDDVQIIHIGSVGSSHDLFATKQKEKLKKQSKLDAWSKSGTGTTPASSSNRSDVLELSKSVDNPLLRQIEAQRARAKAKAKLPDKEMVSRLKESRQREKAEKAKRDAEAIARARQIRGETGPGDGSGLLGLGGAGKDRSDIMVNSSDEESDEDDDSDSDSQLATLSAGGQKSLNEADKRRLQALRDLTRRPVKKTRQQRSVKEMRARLIPPMDRLHNAILAWDIFHNGNDPPNGPKASEVATKYMDPRSYQETFFPLLASEAWRSFVTAKDEVTGQPFGMKIASRASVDSYLEVAFTMPIVQNKDRGVSEGDILLVSEAEKPLLDVSARHCLARVHRITYKKDLIEVTYRVASRNNQLTPVLTPGNTVHGIKITNMTTIEREYAALESLQYYDLMDEILKAEPSPIIRYGEEKISNWMENWTLNRGQALAVLGAQDNDGFTLIQGPPGTGKTKTIIAMVGSLLSEQLAQAGGTGVPIGGARPPNAPNNQTRPKKLLVCAPSNAAVDELVLRLKGGIKTTGGKVKNINVLRLGRTDAINAAVKDVTLDELVKIRLEGDTTRDKAKADRDKLHEDAAKVKEELSHLRPRLEASRGDENRALYNELSRKFEELKRQQMQIGKQIDANKDSGNSIAREMELRRRQIQQEILNSAHVICATLSGSGHEMFRNLDVEFETVIIDEAAQCVELSALIPLKYGCCKCILVGDPKQLPPTVLSQSAARFGYDQSLFVRMQQNHPQSVHLLDMQYRMHPEISMFPSKEFYEGQLQDGQDMLQLRQQPWHRSALLGPYRFFDVQGVQERGHRGQSLVNMKELEVALQMYDRFSKEYGSECDLKGKIGIITPYKAQLFELRNRFRARYGEGITEIIEFNTTDAFQGRECEIIIFSCVRASSTGGIGFMTDIRRMNVGLTRAKSSLWILGDSRALVQGEFWKKLIEDAQGRDRYTKGDVLSMFRKPLERAKPGTYTVAPKPVPKPPPPAPVQKEDIDMKDAPPIPASLPSTTHTAARQQGSANELKSQDTSETKAAPRTAVGVSRSMDQGMEGPPVIRTAADKKRPLESPDGAPPSIKRVANDKPKSGLMSKFGQKPLKPAKPPTDPSAMSALGMVPPERPPAIPNAGAVPKPQVANKQGMPSGQQQPPRGNNNGPLMPRKKAKPSLFVPRKR
ncbi:SEN1 N terminal-domain-containing protein [Stachybotrys elegans]|uniref:SEN1 N terminal-domain-containing protein n=1 Tax=Stachybotrys elegans TaxID=80388 RepID=A0A8K0SFH3_9HYPO|nr:SEN1 N terminal-domain-containing protein [Stachybotrys elegans]